MVNGLSAQAKDICKRRYDIDNFQFTNSITGKLDECHNKAPFNKSKKVYSKYY